MGNYANYWVAAAFCVSGTVMAALGGKMNWNWLIVSDLNVLLFLFIAALLDNRR